MKSKIFILVTVVLLVVSSGVQATQATRVEAESLPPVRIGISGYLKEGVLAGPQTETAAQMFIDSELDWIWMYWSHSLLGAGRPSFADMLQAAGKRIILRTWWWRSGIGDTWTELYNDSNLYDQVLASIIGQIREAGGPDGSNIYAAQLSEAEPCEGYHWDRQAVNMDHFISVINSLYDDIKAQFPNLRVFVGLEPWQLGVGRETAHASDIDPIQLDSYVRAIKKDGLHMYSFYPIADMDVLYDLMLRYKNDPDVRGELLTTTWCATLLESWYGEGYRTPDYARSQFELAASKGIPNICFFGFHADSSGWEELFFNDYEYDPSVPDYQNPYMFKQVMLDLLDEYANSSPNQPPVLNSIGDKTANVAELLQFSISATDPDVGDTLTYSESNLPPGASFDSLTQTFSWTPGYDQAGTYPDVHFEVSDGSLTDTEDITITVANPNIATENLRPNAGGSNTGCNYFDGSYHSPSAGLNYQQVDEEAADDDGTAIYTNSANYVVDTYNIPDHTASGTINHVKVYFRSEANSDSTGARAAIYTHDTLYYGSEESLTSSWADYSHTWTTNPYTGSTWTWDEIDDLEIGVALKRGSYTAWCTQVYVEVEYTSSSYIPGDANQDGDVNSLDITKVKRIIMGLDDPTPGADTNGDGNINAMDITQIELIIMGS